jgi:hypothetical protein
VRLDQAPDAVEAARDREDAFRAETSRQWEARLDALEAARIPAPVDVGCTYCGRDACGCSHGWYVNDRLNGDETW